MADTIELTGTARTETGKAASRRLRRLTDFVPANVYGGGKDPANISLERRVLVKAMENESFYSQVLTLQVAGGAEQAIVREVQRHPASERVVHLDFLRVRADVAINVNIPLHFINEDRCEGVRLGGGTINHIVNEVEVSCLPSLLPDHLEVDVESLNIGDVLHLSDIVLPEGVSIVELSYGSDHDQPVVSIAAPRGGSEEDEASEDAGEDGDAEEGASED